MSDYISKKRVYKILTDLMTESGKEAKIMLSDAKAQIYDEDSADVTKVRHGRWLDRTQEPGWPIAECSVCGSHAGMFWMNYCPNCGARMDSGKE